MPIVIQAGVGLLIMKSSHVLSALFSVVQVVVGNSHDDGTSQWTQEELDELEAKWGFEVWPTVVMHEQLSLDVKETRLTPFSGNSGGTLE